MLSVDLNMPPGHPIDFRMVEWDGADRWRWAMRYLGVDGDGIWLGASPASVRIRPDGVRERIDRSVVRLLPTAGLWCAMWNHTDNLDVYVDVCAQPEWNASLCRVRDLQLDVLRYRDGTVRTLDEDEFVAACERWQYAPALVTRAMGTARTVHSALVDVAAPFNASPLRWLAMASRLDAADFTHD